MGRWRDRGGVASAMVLLLGSVVWFLPATASAWTWVPTASAGSRGLPTIAAARAHAIARATVRAATTRPSASPAGVASVPDGANGQYVAWEDFRDGDGDIYLTRVTNTGTVASGWPASGVAVCTAPGGQMSATIFSDGANGVILGWEDHRTSELTADFYAQRVNSAGNPQWAANGVKVLAGTLVANDVVGAPDGTGGALIAWDHNNGADLDIYAVRYDGTGALVSGWIASGNPVCAFPQDQGHPALVAGVGGSAIVSWVDQRSSPANPEIFAQRMSGGGVPQWTPNGIQLDNGSGYPFSAFAASDGAGGAIVAWNDAFGVLAQRVDGAGLAQWTSGGVTLLGSGANISAVAPDGLGGAIVAGSTGFSGITAQRVNAAGAILWGVNGSAVSTDFELGFDMVADGSGGAYFAWESFNLSSSETDIAAQRVGPGGAPAWGANGTTVSAAPGFQLQPVAVPDGAGGLTSVWIDQRSLAFDFYAQRLDGFGAPLLAADGIPVILDPGVQSSSFTIADGSGGCLLIWSEKLAGGYGIRSRHFASNGTPTGASAPVTALTGDQIIESAVSDGAGGALVSWAHRAGSDYTSWAQHVNAALAPQWTANGVTLSPATGTNFGSSIIPDGSGGAIAAWSELSPGSDVFVQRLNAAGAPQWGASGVALATGGSAGATALVPASGGGAIVVFGESATPGGLFAQRLDGSGNAQWGASPPQILGHDGANAPVPHAVTDGAGGVIALANYDSTDALQNKLLANTLQAQHVDAAGTIQWGSSGTVVCAVDALASAERLLSDGAGGAFAAWSDARTGLYDIRAQRLDGAGTAQWTANGLLLCGATNGQVLSDLVADGAGGAVLAWNDQRFGVNDVYAQRVSAGGTPAWTPDGVIVCNASGGQFQASEAGDGTGATILSWTDNRAAGPRYIYTQRLTAGGAPAWTGNGVVPAQRSLVSALATSQLVRLVWYSPDRLTATVYRQTMSTDWTAIGTVTSDAEGVIAWEDRGVTPGDHLGYRLGVGAAGGQSWFGEVWVDVPASVVLALEGTRPNPAVGDFVVAFALPVASPATLEVFDISGRSVLSKSLVGLPPGRHVVALGRAPRSGLYFLRLRQGAHEVSMRAVVAH
jgi:hypothetical protein